MAMYEYARDARLDSLERDTDADAPMIAFYADGIAYYSDGTEYHAWTLFGILRNRYESVHTSVDEGNPFTWTWNDATGYRWLPVNTHEGSFAFDQEWTGEYHYFAPDGRNLSIVEPFFTP